MTKLVFLLSLMFLFSCSSKPTLEDPPLTDGPSLFGFTGSCRSGVLAPNADRAAALCRPLAGQSRWQIFEIDFSKKTHRQVTWQDGNIDSVDWMTDDQLVYDSNTDELKESPFSGVPADKVGSEIYMSDRFGTQIDRWTERAGEDGQVASARDGRLLYISKRGSSIIVFIRDQQGAFRPVSPMTTTVKFSPALLGRQAAWLERDGEDPELVSVRWQGRKPPEAWQKRRLRSLRAVPGGWLISEVNLSRTGSSVWFVKSDFSCEKLLWLGQERIHSADAAATGSRLLLSLQDASKFRLVTKDLPNEAFSCPTDRGPDKIDE